MSYIYKITNNINQKIYIEKTNLTVEKRWKEHCNDFKKERCEKRPLYNAMNKYGIENFSIETIEECLPEESSEKEKYWIEYYSSFKNGYNATMGGDGKPYIDYELVIKTYNKIQNQTETAKLLNISIDSVRTILKNYNIPIVSGIEIAKKTQSKPVVMINKNNEQLKIFNSIGEAARFLQKENITTCAEKGIKAHIGQVCNGKRQTAYGYKWQFLQGAGEQVNSIGFDPIIAGSVTQAPCQ